MSSTKGHFYKAKLKEFQNKIKYNIKMLSYCFIQFERRDMLMSAAAADSQATLVGGNDAEAQW